MRCCGSRCGPARANKPEPPFGIVARARSCGYCRAMNRDDEKRIAAKLAKIMAMLCVRNTQLETLACWPGTRISGSAMVAVIAGTFF